MSKLKYMIIATLLAIPADLALRAQTSKPATLTAADYLEIKQLVARYSYAVDMHGGGPAFTRHFVTNVVIKPAAQGATGRSYLVTIDGAEGDKPTTMLSGGHYADVYVKTPQGWRIKSRDYVRSEIGPQQ
jgi:hypothetical protein